MFTPCLLSFLALLTAPQAQDAIGADPQAFARLRQAPVDPAPKVTVTESNSRELRFRVEFPAARYGEVTGPDGTTFTRITIPGTDADDGVPGLPAVPIFRTLIAIPRDAEVNVVNTVGDVLDVQSFYLAPFQEPAEEGCGSVDDYLDGNPPPDCVYADKPFAFDAEAYASPGVYPGYSARVQPLGELRDLRVAQISLPAATYEPTSQRITLFSSYEVQLEFLEGQDSFLPETANGPFESARSSYASLLNADILYENLTPVDLDVVGAGEELLILTHPDFFEAAQMLASWKTQKGIPTSVRRVADGAGPGPDTAAEIDAFIEDRYASVAVRPSYLLLFGDAEFVPTFYLQRLNKPPGTMVASDFPYGNTGPNDTDFLAEMAVGRLSVDTPEEAERAAARVILYESAPPTDGSFFGDPFYRSATIASGFECCRDDAPDGTTARDFIQTSEWVRGRLHGAGKSVQRIYGEYLKSDYLGDTTPRFYRDGTSLPPPLAPSSGFGWGGSGSDVVDAFNARRFLIMHISHGYTKGWGQPGFNTNQFSGLENGDYLPVVFSLNCSTGYFDLETDASPSSHECFAERLILEEGGGAIAVIAGTRMTNTGFNDRLAKAYLDALWPGFLPNFGPETPRLRLGDILNHGRLWMFEVHGYEHWNARNHVWLYHVLGDPTLEVWLSDPNAFELPDEYFAEQHPFVLDVTYAAEGAVVTAWQKSVAGEVLPLGRAQVAGGSAQLELVLTPDPSLEIQFSASLEGAVAKQL